MSDPLSIAASVLAVLDAAAKAIKYLKEVKSGGKERISLRDELRSVTSLLEMLQDRFEEDAEQETNATTAMYKIVAGPGGPLELLKTAAEEIVAKLAPKGKLKTLAQPLRWPFDKEDILVLLGRIERAKTLITLVLQNDLRTIAKMTEGKVDHMAKQVDNLTLVKQNEETEKVLTWLSKSPSREKQQETLHSAQPGTGQWFLDSKAFNDLHSGKTKCLWCPGIPGSGKTRLASLAIDWLDRNVQSAECIVVYVYCDYNMRDDQNKDSILSSLLEQSLRQMTNHNISKDVDNLYRTYAKSGGRPTTKQLSDLLRKQFSSCSSVIVVIDALDEYGTSEEQGVSLLEALQNLGDNLRLLVTSRPSSHFAKCLETAARLDVLAQDQDLQLFLNIKMTEQSRLAKHIQSDPMLRQEIVTAICTNAHGMFLLAALTLASLTRKLTRRDVRASLSKLPHTLDAMYDTTFERLRAQTDEDADMAETILAWVLFASRPLNVTELQHMYALHASTVDGGKPLIFIEDDDLPLGDVLIGACCGLLVIDGTAEIVTFVHYTVQEYLSRKFQDRLFETRRVLGSICLAYLQLTNFSSGVCTSDVSMAERLERFPFLTYAARFWGVEICGLPMGQLQGRLDQFLDNQTAIAVASQVFSLPGHRFSGWSNEVPSGVPAIVLAASFDIPGTLEKLVQQGHDIESCGSDSHTALIRAACHHRTANVTTLLRLGAKIDAVSVTGSSALTYAVAKGSSNVVKALINGGADVNESVGYLGWTNLMHAVTSKSLDCVRVLLESGADCQPRTALGETALSIAITFGYEDIANLLMDSGALPLINAASRRATLQATKKGLTALLSRLSTFVGDYQAVADVGVQREPAAGQSLLAQMTEVQPREAEVLGSRIPAIQVQEHTGIKDHEYERLMDILDGINHTRDLHSRYNVDHRLGRGHFASVYRCARKGTSASYAAKIFKLKDTNSNSVIGIRSEIQALQVLSHEHIVGLIEVVMSEPGDELCLILELSPKGELFNYIVSKQKLDENESRSIYRQLQSAVAYIHGEGWVHRDIKPENILMQDDTHIKLIDFGLAAKISADTMLSDLCGTPSYVAPEILTSAEQRHYDYAVDIWSAGVVLYIILCGFPPFSDELYSKEFPYTLSEQIRAGRFDYPSPYWDSVGDPALDLIDCMLVVDPAKRFTAQQCLGHPWTTNAPFTAPWSGHDFTYTNNPAQPDGIIHPRNDADIASADSAANDTAANNAAHASNNATAQRFVAMSPEDRVLLGIDPCLPAAIRNAALTS